MAFSRVKGGAAAAGLVALLGGAVFAQGDGPGAFGGHGHRGGFGMEGMAGLRQLGLTDDQRAQIRTAMSGHRDEFKALSERARTARQAQAAAISAVPMNEQQVRAASADIAAVQADMAVLRARVHEQVFSVLTPDQQAQARTLAAQRDAMRAQRRAQWQQFQQQQRQTPPVAPQQ